MEDETGTYLSEKSEVQLWVFEIAWEDGFY
jgi:hypothetical protein